MKKTSIFTIKKSLKLDLEKLLDKYPELIHYTIKSSPVTRKMLVVGYPVKLSRRIEIEDKGIESAII